MVEFLEYFFDENIKPNSKKILGLREETFFTIFLKMLNITFAT